MTITELTGALGITAATLRHWEAQGLPVQVRDARVIHQLRTAGYGIPLLREVLPTLLDARGASAVNTGLEVRDQHLTDRSHALLRAAAALRDLLAADRPVDRTAEPHQDLS